MPNPARYAADLADGIRALLRNSDAVIPSPGAARAAGNAADFVVDPDGVARAARQMELPLGQRAAQDFEPGGPMWREMNESARVQRNMTVNRDRHMNNTMPVYDSGDDFLHAMRSRDPDMDLGSDLWHQMDKSARGYENIVKGRTGNLRNQNPGLARIAQQNIQGQNAAAAAQRAAATQPSGAMDLAMDIAVPAALVGGAGLAASQMGSPQPPAAEATTADLAAESRPVPAVAATDADGIPTDEAAFTEMFKRQYQAREDKRQQRGAGGYADPSDKAKAILEDLNARRRQAGSEVPEAAQMMADANRLIAMGNEQRNAPGYTPRKASDPREQAQILLQKLNADRMEAGGEVPHSQQVMAEVRRLQAMGDQQRWPSR